MSTETATPANGREDLRLLARVHELTNESYKLAGKVTPATAATWELVIELKSALDTASRAAYRAYRARQADGYDLTADELGVGQMVTVDSHEWFNVQVVEAQHYTRGDDVVVDLTVRGADGATASALIRGSQLVRVHG